MRFLLAVPDGVTRTPRTILPTRGVDIDVWDLRFLFFFPPSIFFAKSQQYEMSH